MVNKKKIGNEFEKIALDYLKNIFEHVEWLGKTKAVDFICWKDNKKYLVDAKSRKNKVTKINLPYNQRNVDFLIVRNAGQIEIWDKDRINKCCKIDKERVISKRIKNLPKGHYQVRYLGNSLGIIFDREDCKIHNLKVGDILDFDIDKVKEVEK